MNNSKFLSVIIIIAFVILSVVAFFVLPDTVITQFSVGSSNATTMPKPLAICIPTVLGIAGGISLILFGTDAKAKTKSLIVCGVGILVFILMFIVNI